MKNRENVIKAIIEANIRISDLVDVLEKEISVENQIVIRDMILDVAIHRESLERQLKNSN